MAFVHRLAPAAIAGVDDFLACTPAAARSADALLCQPRVLMDWQEATFICDGVWLGNRVAARHADWLRLHGIRVLVDCADDVPPPTAAVLEAAGIAPEDVHELGIREVRGFDAAQCLRRGAAAVQRAVATGMPVLVSCYMGINRSASCVAAWLVAHRRCTLADALAFVRWKRPIVCPNPEMWPHLLRIEAEARPGLPPSVTLEQVSGSRRAAGGPLSSVAAAAAAAALQASSAPAAAAPAAAVLASFAPGLA